MSTPGRPEPARRASAVPTGLEDRRPPGAYLHPEPHVAVPFAIAAFLDDQISLPRLQSAARDHSPQALAVLQALMTAAIAEQERAAASGGGRKPLDVRTEVAPALTEMSTGSAADALGITSRAVRLACETGRLKARRDDDGNWRIAPPDLETFRASRAS